MNHVSLIQKWSQMGVAANDGRLGVAHKCGWYLRHLGRIDAVATRVS